MRRTSAHAGVSILALMVGASLGCAGPASAQQSHIAPKDPVVVVTGLDNPRQLTFDGATLLIAEAGSGGDTCGAAPPDAPPDLPAVMCGGTTGGIGAVDHPDGVVKGQAHRVLDGLFSIAGPDGSSAVGSNGVDVADLPGQFLLAETFSAPGLPPEVAALPGVEQLGHLLVAAHDGHRPVVVPYADIVAAEAEQNPDGAQIDSNPYGILFVDPTPGGEPATDGYALVADAGANAVWKIEPDHSAVPAACTGAGCIPPYAITVFAAYPTPPDDEITPEFVPTSLAADSAGNVYVGGLGSLSRGAAEVREYSADGEQLDAWGGFSGISGMAVDAAGEHLYVSQLLGSDPAASTDGAPGNVVRVDLAAGTYQRVDVPFPGGVALDERGRVYVSAFSTSPAEGLPASQMRPITPGGQVWALSFDGREQIGLPTRFPQDTGGQFVPAEPISTQLSRQCAGQTVDLAPGDLTGAWRVTRDERGDRVEFRGAVTVDVVGRHGEVLVDELDVSGSGYQFAHPDGSFEFSFDGPHHGHAASPEEEAAYAAAGLPLLPYWTSGTLAGTISPEGAVTLTSVPDDVIDLCSLLPAA